MPKSLRDCRIDAIKVLYSLEFDSKNIAELASYLIEEVDQRTIDFATGITNDKDRIDELIEKSLTNYSLSRLNLVDKEIVRLATYEMMNGVAYQIAINEALEITKIYSDSGDKKAVSFNNKLLDNIKNNMIK